MIFQHAEMSFSGFEEDFIFLLLLLFIYLLHLHFFSFFSYFCINFCILYGSVISIISPLLLLIVYCTDCGLQY